MTQKQTLIYGMRHAFAIQRAIPRVLYLSLWNAIKRINSDLLHCNFISTTKLQRFLKLMRIYASGDNLVVSLVKIPEPTTKLDFWHCLASASLFEGPVASKDVKINTQTLFSSVRL
jgi:hypothetical protein